MSAKDFSPEAALAQLAEREQHIAATRLAAAKFCLHLAVLSGNDGLYGDTLNHFALGQDARSRKRRAREYGFWLSGAHGVDLPSDITLTPRAVAFRIDTDDVPRGDDDGISIALHTDPGQTTARVQLEVFQGEPRWWFDWGATDSNVGDQFDTESHETMLLYPADQVGSSVSLEKIGDDVITSLSIADWEETVTFRGNLF